MMRPPATQACKIPVSFLRKFRVLYLIGRFSEGCFGKLRLQKVAYFSEKRQRTKLFTFRKAPQGPFSEDLNATLEELLSMGLVVAEPVGVRDGNKYRLAEPAMCQSPFGDWLAATDQEAKGLIDEAVQKYGYLKHDDLVEAGHKEKAFQEAEFFDEMLVSNAADLVEVGLTADECEDVALSLAPGFASTISKLPDAIRSFDFRKVRTV